MLHMNVFDIDGTLSARAHQGLNASPIGLARVVALAIGISLSIAMPLDAQASEKQIRWAKQLAKEQLTDKQELCHHEIVYRESRWNYKAVGNKAGTKQVYGLYQMKTESLKNSSSIKQFWMYYHYVGYRYGWTKYEDPNYCGALHHLKTKGWQ
jgi:phosphoglycolate phosphatase-like HAD superfamily hydrolase